MKKLSLSAIALATLSCAFTSAADPTPKAVWDSAENTFTFYYDENTYEGDGITQYAIPTGNAWNTEPAWYSASPAPKSSVTTVVFDASFAAYKPVNLNYWFSGFSKLTSVVHLEYLDTSRAGYSSYMFNGCSSLTSLDLSHFETATMQFRAFFNGCSKIETLDLTSFTTVTDCRSVFAGMSKLKTIYVTELFTWAGNDDSKTFNGCNSLVGGAGTAYATVKNAAREYGRIDDPDNGKPGYFTYRAKAAPPVINEVSVSSLTHESAVIEVSGDTLNGGTVTVELTTAGGHPLSSVNTDFGAFSFADLTPETQYSVQVVAESEFGATTNTAVSFETPAMPADYWLYDADAGTISRGSWKFAATLANNGTLSVGAVAEWPSGTSELDFSVPVKDEEQTAYVISALNPAFGHHDKASSYKPEGYEPQCLRVGLLTLPGEGLVSIGTAAFAGCANASGTIRFPSTLTNINTSAFADCPDLAIDGSTLPENLTTISQYCFRGAAKMFGDVALPNARSVADSGFQGTGISSASFGPDLVSVGGNYDRGAFQNCKALTNVTFDAASSVQMTSGFTFKGCSALEELDLRCVINLTIATDRDDYSHIASCTNLRKLTFGAGLTNLTCNAIAGAKALEEIVFEGLPPVGFEMPYLASYDRNGGHTTGYDTKTIKTYVHSRFIDVPNAASVCWADYAADRKIARERMNPANNTTWASDFIVEGVDPVLRPLVTIEQESGTVLIVQ